MAGRSKVKDYEKLDNENLTKVIGLLESDAPITKKAACEILNISYNTKRLDKLIEEFKEKQAFNKRKRAEMRSKPVTTDDIKFIISEYLDSTSMEELSDRSFRSVNVIKNVLNKHKIPMREAGSTYRRGILLPDDSAKEEYQTGDLVFSARYNVPARVKALKQVDETHGNVYLIQLLGEHQQNAFQPAYELGDLTYIEKELGVKLNTM